MYLTLEAYMLLKGTHWALFLSVTIYVTKYAFIVQMKNIVDPDQLASLEASWSGLNCFPKKLKTLMCIIKGEYVMK